MTEKFSYSPVVSVYIEKLNLPAMSEEDEIGNWIDGKTCDTLESTCKHFAVAAVHLCSNHRLLTSNVGPEKQTSNGMNCDTSRLF